MIMAPLTNTFWKKMPGLAQARADKLFQARRYQEAFSLWAAAAQGGNALAQFNIAKCYMDGIGVPVSHREGMVWLRKSADHGHRDAQLMLASIFASGLILREPDAPNPVAFGQDLFEAGEPQYAEALHWAKQAGDDPRAHALAGFILTAGPLALRDENEGAKLYRQSAEAACPEGMLGHGLILLRTDRAAGARMILQAHEVGLLAATLKLAEMLEAGDAFAQDIPAAFRLYLQAAEGGFTQAQLRVGRAMVEGIHLPHDTALGLHWMTRAAQGGDMQAAFEIGEWVCRGNPQDADYSAAARWYGLAAKSGHSGAARALGLLHVSGHGVEKDPHAAREWLERALALGNEDAQADLANSLLGGGDALIDPEKIVGWYRTAARNGDVVAAFNLGLCHLNGIGVAVDEERGAFWIGKAAARLPDAQFLFGQLLAEGRGLAPDLRLARDYFRIAAETGLPGAVLAYGEMLAGGHGGPRDPNQAEALYLEAIARDHLPAMHALGELLMRVSERKAEAFSWLMKSAEAGAPQSQEAVAHCLATGEGCEMNMEQAQFWLGKSQQFAQQDELA
jgi:uncharacterized protein